MGPILQLHFCPQETLQRVAAVRHRLCPRPGPALVGMEKAGWPWPCLVSTHFLYLLNQSPGTFPRASLAMASRLESRDWETGCL